jgi:beta-glucosidase
VADVLIGQANGKPRFDFAGKLSFSWPKRPDQTPLNVGDPDYDPQFAYGYGLHYGDASKVGTLAEVQGLSPAAERGMMLKDGVGVNGFALSIGDAQAPVIAAVGARVATYGKEALTLRQIDRNRQQDAWAARWTGAEPAWIELRNARPVDLSREANGAMVLAIDLRVVAPPTGPVMLGLGGDKPAALNIAPLLAGGERWRTVRVPLRCFGPDLSHVTTLRIESGGATAFDFARASIQETRADDRCPR